MRLFVITFLCLLTIPFGLGAQQTTLSITTKNGTVLEARGKEQLARIVAAYDIDRWLFTKEVIVASRVIPHSHPVLTVNTRYVNNDTLQLATFLHEQFHWLEELKAEDRDAAMAEFREHFPNVPDRESGGARDAESSYLHLIVCDLEFQAMTELVGEAKARAILSDWDHYSWVYEQVLNNPIVREVNTRHGFLVP